MLNPMPTVAHYDDMMYAPSNDHAWVGLVALLLFWIAVIVIAVLAYRLLKHRTPASTPRSPLDIAKERFAKGEISKEDLAEIRTQLREK